jgi:hypothetical protein
MESVLAVVISMVQFVDPFTYLSEDEFRFLWMTAFNLMFSEAWTRVILVMGVISLVWYWITASGRSGRMQRGYGAGAGNVVSVE